MVISSVCDPVADLIVDETGRALHDVSTSQRVTLHELGGVTGNGIIHTALAALAGIGGQLEGVCNKVKTCMYVS